MFSNNTMPKKMIILKDDVYFQKFKKNFKEKNNMYKIKLLLKDKSTVKYISR